MSTKVRELVEGVRSMLEGGLSDVRSVLAADYHAGIDTQITMRFGVPGMMVGSLVSADLATFYVVKVSSDGKTLDVLPSADGGADVDVAENTILRIRPRFLTSAIYREWVHGLQRMSSPANGIYGYGSFEIAANPVSGVYPLPDSWGDKRPQRLLVARYHKTGTIAWQSIGAEWQLDQNAVRIFGTQPVGTTLEFVFAFPFMAPTSLDFDAEECGLNEWTMDIPGMFAAAALGRTLENRRNQLKQSGDSRRAGEVPAGANLGVSRDWLGDAQRRINEECARLQGQFSYQWSSLDRDQVPMGTIL